jgi:hypothetical protein
MRSLWHLTAEGFGVLGFSIVSLALILLTFGVPSFATLPIVAYYAGLALLAVLAGMLLSGMRSAFHAAEEVVIRSTGLAVLPATAVSGGLAVLLMLREQAGAIAAGIPDPWLAGFIVWLGINIPAYIIFKQEYQTIIRARWYALSLAVWAALTVLARLVAQVLIR